MTQKVKNMIISEDHKSDKTHCFKNGQNDRYVTIQTYKTDLKLFTDGAVLCSKQLKKLTFEKVLKLHLLNNIIIFMVHCSEQMHELFERNIIMTQSIFI